MKTLWQHYNEIMATTNGPEHVPNSTVKIKRTSQSISLKKTTPLDPDKSVDVTNIIRIYNRDLSLLIPQSNTNTNSTSSTTMTSTYPNLRATNQHVNKTSKPACHQQRILNNFKPARHHELMSSPISKICATPNKMSSTMSKPRAPPTTMSSTLQKELACHRRKRHH